MDAAADERVVRLRTVDECEKFARNVDQRLPELALAARRKAVELQAAQHNATTQAEREALQAVYAYERVLTARNGRPTKASRTWPMIQRHGILAAVERAVNRTQSTKGYEALVAMGMQDLAFEAVVCRYPDLFSEEAVRRSRSRMNEWNHAGDHESPGGPAD